MNADLTGSALDSYLNAVQNGDYVNAAMVVADQYGIDPDLIMEAANVSGIDTDLAEVDDEDE